MSRPSPSLAWRRAQKVPKAPVYFAVTLTVTILLLVFRNRAATYSFIELISISRGRISKPKSRSQPIVHSKTPTQCILYDRPPRTASTTIGTALHSCLRKYGYSQPQQPSLEARTALVSHMLALPAHRKAILSRHLYLNATSVKLLRYNCHMILYISSCAPMKRRLWSAVKYTVAGGHGNASLSEQQMKKAFNIASRSDRQLQFLRAYPYVDNHKHPLHVYDPLIPDYVIRVHSLDQDLRKLLHAFGCNTTYVSGNIHQASQDEHALLDSLQVGKDTTYQRLMELANEKNERSLLKAAVFVKET
ncbi:unnamed protein product [Agarophyton chilense]